MNTRGQKSPRRHLNFNDDRTKHDHEGAPFDCDQPNQPSYNDDSPYRFSSPPVTTPLKTPIRNGN